MKQLSKYAQKLVGGSGFLIIVLASHALTTHCVPPPDHNPSVAAVKFGAVGAFCNPVETQHVSISLESRPKPHMLLQQWLLGQNPS